jgi:predicted aspartyl protease
MHLFPTLFRAVAMLALATAASSAVADPARLRAAMQLMDIPGMKAAAESPAERKLAEAVELSWTLRDDEAEAAFPAAIGMQSDTGLRAAALWELMSLRARQGEFTAAVSAGETASQLQPATASQIQALVFMKGLAGVAPTRAVGDPSGAAEIKRDLAGLRRADITIGGVATDAILDTGANFSTINTTMANRMGLLMLDAEVSVGSSSRDAVPSRLGIAERLTIGGAEFANVVFIVLPDADLSFANGAYTIEAILGMPVFFEMKRIAFATVDGKENFLFGDRAPAIRGSDRNILYNGNSPLIDLTVSVKGAPRRLSLLLDSGAQQTSFSARVPAEHPSLLEGAATVTSQRGGAGGVVVSDKTRRIASLDATVGGKPVTLKNIDVHEDQELDRHGILGLDALGGGFTIGWRAGVLVAN